MVASLLLCLSTKITRGKTLQILDVEEDILSKFQQLAWWWFKYCCRVGELLLLHCSLASFQHCLW
jgi:hypothetical protein